jgi:hypothetical protein
VSKRAALSIQIQRKPLQHRDQPRSAIPDRQNAELPWRTVGFEEGYLIGTWVVFDPCWRRCRSNLRDTEVDGRLLRAAELFDETKGATAAHIAG